jgi:hypothetical protein
LSIRQSTNEHWLTGCLAVPWRFKKRLYEEEEEKTPQTRINTRGAVPYLELVEPYLELVEIENYISFQNMIDIWNG